MAPRATAEDRLSAPAPASANESVQQTRERDLARRTEAKISAGQSAGARAATSAEAASPIAAPSEPSPAADPAGPTEASKAQVGSPETLRLAAETGDLKRLQQALDQPTDVNSRDDAGRTALLLAILHGQTKAVKVLLAHGANPNIADVDGVSPLSAATAANQSAIIRMLKDAGAH
jgi:ankyrin repeat protein